MLTSKSIILLVAVIIAVSIKLSIGHWDTYSNIKLDGEGKETAVQELKTNLAKLAAGEGPKYTVENVVYVRNLSLAANFYRMQAVLRNSFGDQVNCTVDLSWTAPVRVGFWCNEDDADDVVVRYVE